MIKYFGFFLLFSCFDVHAITANISYSEGSLTQHPGGYLYTQWVDLYSIDDIGEKEDSTPTRCVNVRSCYVAIAMVIPPSGMSPSEATAEQVIVKLEFPKEVKNPTEGDVLRALRAHLPLSGRASRITNYAASSFLCIGIVSKLGGSVNHDGSPLARLFSCADGSGGVLPPPPDPNPEPVTCSMDSIILEHGEMNTDDVNGREVTKKSLLTCNGSADVTITVDNSGVINLVAGELLSTIYIDGVKGKKTVSVKGSLAIDFSSVLTLIGNGRLSGEYSKSAIVNFNII